jgi:hypothetical protein
MKPKQEEALRDYLRESIVPLIEDVLTKKLGQAITFAKEELTAPVQEPVAWRVKWPAIGGGHKWIMSDKPLLEKEGFVNQALYTTPPAARRQWVGLTEPEVNDCYESIMFDQNIEPSRMGVYLEIEAKLRSKNT